MILVFFLHALQQYEQILTEIEVCLEMSCIDGLSWNLNHNRMFSETRTEKQFSDSYLTYQLVHIPKLPRILQSM